MRKIVEILVCIFGLLLATPVIGGETLITTPDGKFVGRTNDFMITRIGGGEVWKFVGFNTATKTEKTGEGNCGSTICQANFESGENRVAMQLQCHEQEAFQEFVIEFGPEFVTKFDPEFVTALQPIGYEDVEIRSQFRIWSMLDVVWKIMDVQCGDVLDGKVGCNFTLRRENGKFLYQKSISYIEGRYEVLLEKFRVKDASGFINKTFVANGSAVSAFSKLYYWGIQDAE